jgi:hypothetical protein
VKWRLLSFFLKVVALGLPLGKAIEFVDIVKEQCGAVICRATFKSEEKLLTRRPLAQINV